MSATEETLSLLRSIDGTLKAMLALAKRRTPDQKVIASDKDLDGKYGDPKVTFDPRDWTGPSFKGCNLSQCPAEFLDLLAETYAYFALKNETAGAVTDKGKPKAEFDRRSEGRARGWAKRVREGWKAPQQQAGKSDGWGADESSGDWPTADEIFGGEA